MPYIETARTGCTLWPQTIVFYYIWRGSDGSKTPYIETAPHGLYADAADRAIRIRSVNYAAVYVY
jgi:hypothetical protein